MSSQMPRLCMGLGVATTESSNNNLPTVFIFYRFLEHCCFAFGTRSPRIPPQCFFFFFLIFLPVVLGGEVFKYVNGGDYMYVQYM